MILITNQQRRFAIEEDSLRASVQRLLDTLGYVDFDIGILLTTNRAIKQYNKQYRNKDVVTDVLSFPFHQIKAGKHIVAKTADEKNLGDIIIAPAFVWDKLAESADWHQKQKKEQLILLHKRTIELIVHGLCHLLGYDHDTDADYKAMQQKERQLLQSLVK